MNIFILNADHTENAKAHCNKHIVKMPLELTQLLCTAHHLWGEQTDRKNIYIPYQSTHANHPSAIFTRSNTKAYNFVLELARALCVEYSHRYNKEHAVEKYLWSVLAFSPEAMVDFSITESILPDVPLCMPEYIKNYFKDFPHDSARVVNAYRSYYLLEKAHLLDYKKRIIPEWIVPLQNAELNHYITELLKIKPTNL